MHFQATSLGRYLLYTMDERFVGASTAALPAVASELLAAVGATSAVGAVTKPGPFTTWSIAAEGSDPAAIDPTAFTITLPASGQALAAAPGGAAALVDDGAADGAGRWTFTPVDGCAAWPEVELGVSGEPAGGDRVRMPRCVACSTPTCTGWPSSSSAGGRTAAGRGIPTA